ncbi:primosomal protein N' [Geobacter sp. FeAm09]|uniref:replication restart helicase PriA n=1 Tax=Geobacter sp. FeAm09 TaxID=2597769 RepID=UPI0011F062E5|nr:primosomal protein N' [Geobacter sp. FeAm09]QEM69180.1 primosomal protein N' [Geobacter sp. FeAm09]
MSTPAPHIVEVAIPLHLDRTFHYRVPSGMAGQPLAGRRVFVPFGRRRMTGYILGDVAETPPHDLKEILELLDPEPLWTDSELEFFRWVASYYLHPLGEVLKTALPAGINIQDRKGSDQNAPTVGGGKAIKTEMVYRAATAPEPLPHLGAKAAAILDLLREGRSGIPAAELRRRFGTCSPQLGRLTELGLVTGEAREVYRNPFGDDVVERDTPRLLSPHQQTALDALCAALDRRAFAPFLLHGVTGSGKTEVYLQAIAQALGQDKTALVLVPEISLTPQLVQRFRARFGHGIAILHSGLSDGERYDEWRRIRRGQARIVIGARSAIFAPLERIGIIIVDEEHEASFKQADGLRYNARDLALVRGRMEHTVVLLGSATPLVTSRYAAEHGKLALLTLPERVEQRPMPTVELAPMKGVATAISPLLIPALETTLAAGGQAIIFLNRRGFATYLVCAECGAPLACPNCSVSLTYHRQRGQSVCHYCDYAIPAPGICPACGCQELKELGAGTERLEHDLRELLPQARILRMDSDTTGGKGSHGRLLARMSDGSADILVGTQMIAKGHDFPGVTLVGVVNAEASLGMPDFRAAERTFQILSQVIGRAGRGDAPGRVVVQAQSGDHYAIQCAVRHDDDAFYRQELEFRREVGYPPFSFLACLGFSGTAERPVEEHAETTARLLMHLKRGKGLRVEILGPAPAPLYRLRGRFRRQILLKSPTRGDLRRLIAAWRQNRPAASAIRTYVDIDPVDMM